MCDHTGSYIEGYCYNADILLWCCNNIQITSF